MGEENKRPAIVFDIGGVIRRFDPLTYLLEKYPDGETAEAIYAAVFRAREWVELDRGTISTPEATALFRRRKPEREKEITEVMSDWFRHMRYIPETVALIRELAAKGYRLYYLSNMHESTSPHIKDDFDFWGLFADGLFSWEVKQVKPEPEIFRSFCDRCSLDPRECVFLDDSLENVEAARAAGMRSVHYDDPARATAELWCRLGLAPPA